MKRAWLRFQHRQIRRQRREDEEESERYLMIGQMMSDWANSSLLSLRQAQELEESAPTTLQ